MKRSPNRLLTYYLHCPGVTSYTGTPFVGGSAFLFKFRIASVSMTPDKETGDTPFHLKLPDHTAEFCSKFPEGRLCRLINKRSGTLLDVRSVDLADDSVPRVVGTFFPSQIH